MANIQHARPLSPQSHVVDEQTPLLPHAGPSEQSSRTQKRGSRSRSKRNQRSIDASEYSCSDVESLTRRTYSTSSGPSFQTSTHQGCSHAARSRSSVTYTSTCDSPPKTSANSAQDLQDEDECPICDEEDVPPQSEPWSFFSSIFTAYDSVSLRLENSGSVARDHLASERTFLAYMRTSLAIASAGVALVQLFSAAASSSPEGSTHRLHTYIRPLGASTIGIGIIVLLIGAVRYFKIQAALTKGYFPVSRITSGFIAIMLTVLVTVTFAILLSGKLEARRK